MTLSGNLKDLNLFNLIQMLCHDERETRLVIQNNGQRANLFLAEGNIVHAALGDLEGDEAFFALLAWQQGEFTAERPGPAPTQTIFAGWSGLLMEGARRLDERGSSQAAAVVEAANAGQAGANPEAGRPASLSPLEERLWSQRAELAGVIRDLASAGAGLQGLILVSKDGLLLAAETTEAAYEPAKIAALAAGLLGMGQRSAHQLKQRYVEQVMVRAELGYLLILRVNTELLLVGIMPPDGNLGLTMLELNKGKQRLATVCGE